MAAESDAATSKASSSKAEEEADQKSEEAVAQSAAAVDGDQCREDDDDVDDEADPVIQNLNLMSRRKLMPAEWIENRRKRHYEEIDLYNRSYDALENEDIESDDEAFTVEYEEWSERHWASIDFSRVNNVGGESRGMDAVAVYPAFLHAPKSEEEDENHPAAAAAAAVYPAVLRPEEKDADAACAESSS